MDDYLGSFEENARVRRARRQRELASATQQDSGGTTPPVQSGVDINGKNGQPQQSSEFKLPQGSMSGIQNLFTSSSSAESAGWLQTGAEMGIESEGVGAATGGEAAAGGESMFGSLGSIGGIAAIIAAIAGVESMADSNNKDRYTLDNSLVPEGTEGATRTSDAFSGHFFTDPLMTQLLGNDEEPTIGEKMDADIAEGEWGKSLEHMPAAINYWSDPGGNILGMAADKYLGDGWSWLFNPVGNGLEELGGLF